MLLCDLLELSHSNSKNSAKRTHISEVYGIIYRIHCIPENKDYIGQTHSHVKCKDYLSRHGIITRCKIHYRDRILETYKDRPLYKALIKYETDDFEVFEEKRIYGQELSRINQIEGEYIAKYNSLIPNGYNIEEVGKKYGIISKMLEEHYEFKTEENNYVDKTRGKRKKDVTFGQRFNMRRVRFNEKLFLDTLKTIEIESVRLINSRGLRILIREKGAHDNIRIYFTGTKEACIEFAKQISPNVEITETLKQTGFKYQDKLDKIVEKLGDACTRVSGTIYKNIENENCGQYSMLFFGKKNNRTQELARLSIGGKNILLSDCIPDARKFIELFKVQTSSKPIFFLQ